MQISFDDPRIQSFNRVLVGGVITSTLTPALPLTTQIPIAAGLLAGKLVSMHNASVRNRESLTRYRRQHIGESNYAPSRLKENLKWRW